MTGPAPTGIDLKQRPEVWASVFVSLENPTGAIGSAS
jgi:hypothetical protein